jgi:coproporphyrinogen III oxidase-like Fe-S oxidoreductase
MFDLQILPDEPLIKFKHQFPMFNWPYPGHREENILGDRYVPYKQKTERTIRRQAIYVHIPFCETICNFCPFSRDKIKSESDIELYVKALIAELDIKNDFLGRRQIDAIFVGGGTPSLLHPREITLLGDAIARNFDLSTLREFTFEVEVKSVSRDKLQALRGIGVNRISFGVQTFSDLYRTLFSLDATAEQINSAAELLTNTFSYTNVDLLYGLAGQDLNQVEQDVIAAVKLGTTTIDVYPINNFSASRSMHLKMEQAGLKPLSEKERVEFRIFIRKLFRELGYRPISGYGFSKAEKVEKDNNNPVQDYPKFLYHDLVYGYQDDAIIGYGSSALSHFPGFNLQNYGNRKTYVRELLIDRELPHVAFGPLDAPERGVVTFPFRGVLEKEKIAWCKIPSETIVALESALNAKLVTDRGGTYVLTEVGWLFYVNLMYHFMPTAGKEWIVDKMAQLGRHSTSFNDTDLSGLDQGIF